MVNHSLYQPSRPRDCVALDLFWPSLPNSCPSQPDNLFCSYQSYKHRKILELSMPQMDLNRGLFPTPSMPPLSITASCITQPHSVTSH